MNTLFRLVLANLLIVAAGYSLTWARPLGPNPTLVFEGKVGFSATADTLLECGGVACGGAQIGGVNCNGRDRSSVTLDDIPESETLRVLHARLNWVASTPANQAPDNEVTLALPGGASVAAIASPELSEAFQDGAPPQDCQIAGVICGADTACQLGFYSNYADVTAQVQEHHASGGALNGVWTLSDVDIPGARGDDPATAIAALGSLTIGAWSLIIVYEDNANFPTRRLYYYQGFELNSGVDRRLFPSGFLAPPDPTVDLALMVLEGDLAIQGDQLSVNGRQVTDACNPVNNLFNGTVNTGTADGRCRQGVTGVDLDRFFIERAIQAGDEEAEILLTIPRGDGILTAGEQLFTNWMILAFDHLLPDFDSFKPEKEAVPRSGSEVHPGDEILYRIKIQNRGDAAAQNVLLTDQVPRGTRYIAGSARLDMEPFPDDPGGQMPLQAGLLMTDLAQVGDAIEVGQQHFFEFTVRVNEDAPHGFQITNIARISADLVDDVRTDPVVHLVRTTDGGLPEPLLDAGESAADAGAVDAGDVLAPVQDGGGEQADTGGRVTRDMRTDGPYPECEPGFRYDPQCTPAGCVPEARPSCGRFCPQEPQSGLVPVECNTGLAATACAEGRECVRISIDDPSVWACVLEDSIPYPSCAGDGDCAFGKACHDGLCLTLCSSASTAGGGRSSGCDCDSGDGAPTSGTFALLLIGLALVRRWRTAA